MASAHAVIGVDIGTSGCKAVVLDRAGRVIATATDSYPTRRRADGEVSQDARDWLRATGRVLRELAGGLGPVAIQAIGLTAPAHYAVLVGPDGDPLQRVLLASDGRPGPLAAEMASTLGPAFIDRTGNALQAGWSLPQLAWLKRQDPVGFERAIRVAVSKDFVRYRMTGALLTDPSDAVGMALAERRTLAWDPELVGLAGLAIDRLPEIAPAISLAGGLARDWARATGLMPGIPVAVGATDTAAELVSVGATEPGSSIAKIASTGTIVAVGSEAQPEPRLLTYPHAVPDRWYSAAVTNTAATAYTWLRETMFERAPTGPRTAYAEMDRLASRVPPGADGLRFLPFLEGERTPYWNTSLRASFQGLSSGHGPAHLCRAVLEGVAFSLRDGRDVLTSTGRSVDQPILSGGGMASRLWREILVAVLGGRARRAEPQGPAIGAALIAAAAAGVAPAANGYPAARPRYRDAVPPAGWTEAYERLFPAYRAAAQNADAGARPG